MDIDINKMFQEKNKDIFKNSLMLEMERNLDALKHTTDNCIALEVNKLNNFFKPFFDESNIKYKPTELKSFLKKEEIKLNEIINKNIEEKKEKVLAYFSLPIDCDIISQEYIDKYYETINKTSEELVEKLELEVRDEICTKFTPSICKKYVLKKEEQKERIVSRIDQLFCKTVIRRVIEENIFRDGSLKNMCRESYERYLSLNKQTLEN